MKYLGIMDIPAPWREPVFERVGRELGADFHVVYFRDNETRRLWKFPHGKHSRSILPGYNFVLFGVERFFNPGIVGYLLRNRPRVALIFASTKDPSGFLALLTCRLLGTKIILMSDTWMGRDRNINWIQRLVRRVIYRWFADAYVGASKRTLEMFAHYNPKTRPEQGYLSHLVADNDFFTQKLAAGPVARDYDVLLSGRIAPEKNPVFFAEVCGRIKARRGRCRALVMGSGSEELKAAMEDAMRRLGVDYHFAGFIQRDDLPAHYARAKLLLLPSGGDCWGVVINEAMAAGTPVITTEWTAAAGELVLDGVNGHVLPLDEEVWSERICGLLDDPARLDAFGRRARETVARFSFDTAAAGMVAALRGCASGGGGGAAFPAAPPSGPGPAAAQPHR